MTTSHHRDHLEHLPGRTFLAVIAVIAALAGIVAVLQLVDADRTIDSVLWAITLGLATLSLLAVGIAWEERRAHVHALVREALEVDRLPEGADPIAELLRMGAHREADYLRVRAGHGSSKGAS